MRALVVGAGLVGAAAARALREAGWTVETASARDLLAGRFAPAHADPFDGCVFAQGKDVTGRGFARRFDELLSSRIGPMAKAARLPGLGSGVRAVLLSSTVACMPAERKDGRDLPTLQRRYEAAFVERFPTGAILRLAAMRGPGWQIDEGLAGFYRTVLLKRLRMVGGSDIPWADDALLAAALQHAVGDRAPLRLVVARPEGFDINPFLDSGGPLALRIPLPAAVYRGLFQAMGAPPSMLRLSMRRVRRSGWTLFCEPGTADALAAE